MQRKMEMFAGSTEKQENMQKENLAEPKKHILSLDIMPRQALPMLMQQIDTLIN